MLIAYIIALFLGSLLAGLSVFKINHLSERHFKGILAFSGSFLFSLTIVHILPEVYEHKHSLGIWVPVLLLAGFYLQLFLEFFSSGIEHGHMHVHHGKEGPAAMTLMLGLCMHAFLEGMILVHPTDSHSHGESHSLLLGIILHKGPAAFALTSVLMQQGTKRSVILTCLVLFSLSSPIGAAMAYMLDHDGNSLWMNAIYALVAGNFLHISATIFIENNPHHHFDSKRMALLLLGATLGIAIELF